MHACMQIKEKNYIITSGSVGKQPYGKKDNSSPNNLVKGLEKRILAPAVEGKDERHAHNPDKPGEDQVSHRQSIPDAMIEEPVAPSAIIHEDHDNEGHAALKETVIAL